MECDWRVGPPPASGNRVLVAFRVKYVHYVRVNPLCSPHKHGLINAPRLALPAKGPFPKWRTLERAGLFAESGLLVDCDTSTSGPNMHHAQGVHTDSVAAPKKHLALQNMAISPLVTFSSVRC